MGPVGIPLHALESKSFPATPVEQATNIKSAPQHAASCWILEAVFYVAGSPWRDRGQRCPSGLQRLVTDDIINPRTDGGRWPNLGEAPVAPVRRDVRSENKSYTNGPISLDESLGKQN